MVRRKPGSSKEKGIDEKELNKLVKEIELINDDGGIIVVFTNFDVADEIVDRITEHNKTVKKIKVENGDDIAHYLKDCRSFDEDVIVWIFPESPKEDILKALNVFRERFIECGKPNVLVFTLGYRTELQKRAPDFWRYKNNVYEFIKLDRNIPYEYIDDRAAVLDVDEKIEFYEKVLDKIKDKRKKIEILNDLSRLYWTKGELDRAEEYLRKALKFVKEFYRDTTYLPDYAMTLNNLGVLYWNKEEFDKAEKYYQEARRIYGKLAEKNPGYLPDYAMTLNNLGVLYSDKGEFDKAKRCYQEALKIRKKLAEKDTTYLPDYAMTLNNLGVLYWNKEEFDKAEKYYQEARRIYGKLAEKNPGYKYYYAGTLNNLGVLYSDKGEFDKAKRCYQEALKIRKKLAEKDTTYLPDYAKTLIGIGLVYLQIGDIKKGRDYLTQALTLCEKYGLDDLARLTREKLDKIDKYKKVTNQDIPSTCQSKQ